MAETSPGRLSRCARVIRPASSMPTWATAPRSERVTQVQKQHDQITVTRNGRPPAVVVSIDEWESLHETLEILSDPEAVAAIAEAREAIARGEVSSREDIL